MIDDFETILMKMADIHNRYESLRFCQVLGNILGTDSHYYLSDDFVLAAIEKYIEENEI